MPNNPIAQTILLELYRSWLHKTPDSIIPIAESGSSRKYYRIASQGHTVIGTFNMNVEENKSYLYLTQLFLKKGLPVPEVFTSNEDQTAYLQSDLGNVSLFDLVDRSWLTGSFHPSLLDFYREAIRHLIDFQIRGSKDLDFSNCYPEAEFGISAIKDDMNYFRYYFLKLHDINVNESDLNEQFDKFASIIDQYEKKYFMYRDFQARNILIHDNKLHFIDFQGGRKGPLAYDLVSLLFQVRARIPSDYRNLLFNYYLDRLSEFVPVNRKEFADQYSYFVYLRLMQVLGAYGFRGLIQKKSHFIESIPYALHELKNWLESNPLPGEFDLLQKTLESTALLAKQFTKPAPDRSGKLHIRVFSFSYKKSGIPNDDTGNGGGYVFDCRALPNPGRDPYFKTLTGRDKQVIDFLDNDLQVKSFLQSTFELADMAVTNYLKRAFSDLMIAFGCTGGQHRSVYCAEQLLKFLQTKYPESTITLKHIEMDNMLLINQQTEHK